MKPLRATCICRSVWSSRNALQCYRVMSGMREAIVGHCQILIYLRRELLLLNFHFKISPFAQKYKWRRSPLRLILSVTRWHNVNHSIILALLWCRNIWISNYLTTQDLCEKLVKITCMRFDELPVLNVIRLVSLMSMPCLRVCFQVVACLVAKYVDLIKILTFYLLCQPRKWCKCAWRRPGCE